MTKNKKDKISKQDRKDIINNIIDWDSPVINDLYEQIVMITVLEHGLEIQNHIAEQEQDNREVRLGQESYLREAQKYKKQHDLNQSKMFEEWYDAAMIKTGKSAISGSDWKTALKDMFYNNDYK